MDVQLVLCSLLESLQKIVGIHRSIESRGVDTIYIALEIIWSTSYRSALDIVLGHCSLSELTKRLEHHICTQRKA